MTRNSPVLSTDNEPQRTLTELLAEWRHILLTVDATLTREKCPEHKAVSTDVALRLLEAR